MTPIKLDEDLELDLRAYELRRARRPVRLERIPMEILILLVERRGDLVTREQILERVWGNGLSLDTDNAINGGIRKIRQALRDDPENPRFISTVTGKGYRFIAALIEDDAAQPGVIPPAPMAAAPRVDALEASPSPVDAPQAPAPRGWPILLAAVVLLGIAGAYTIWSRSSSTPSQPGERVMLAVLPFENMTGDAGQDYFSDGLTEEMIARLGNLAPARLGVIARTSVMRYKQTHASLDSVSRDLSVQYVLEGSVRRDAENVRITAQLIQVKDQTHVWSRQYDRKQSEVLAVQAEIAQAIADQIELTFGDGQSRPAHPAALQPQDLEAYDYYLKGRFFWNKRSPDGFQKAIESFQEAIARNPREARAYAGLADSYTLMGNYGYASQAEVIPRAREAALKALQLDEGLAAAHTSLALINECYDRDWQTAERRFRRAIQLDLNYATAHHWYAEYLGFQGRFDEALAEMDLARQLDPLSHIIAADRGAILYFARRYDLAIQQFQFVLAIEPTMGRSALIIPAYAQLGRFDDALAYAMKIEGPWRWAWVAHVHGRAGRKAEAQDALRQMEESNRPRRNEPLLLCATANVGMGRTEEALACLHQACEESPGMLTALKVDPIYDPLRSDPRFQNLLRCIGLLGGSDGT